LKKTRRFRPAFTDRPRLRFMKGMVVNMNRQDCINAGINYDDGVARFVGNAGMYEKFLRSFLQDDSFAQLREAMGRGDVGASFQAAHTLKGLTGNLSLERLYKKLVVLTDALRGEGDVIGELIDSLMKQNYPKDLFDVYVLADNCTDDTAAVSRQHGATVYERFDKQNVGKGYALDYLYKHVTMDRGVGYYDGFFVFDADNIVDPQFVAEMNKTFDTGRFDAVTCYRNSKNFGTNWLSAAYSIWFLREARYVNYPRMLLGTSCMISGTGFLVSGKLMEENHGWPYHLLTEDIQFSVNCALNGHMIGYCDKAMVYDEQPTTWSQSWKQRLRWSKGFYQIDLRHIHDRRARDALQHHGDGREPHHTDRVPADARYDRGVFHGRHNGAHCRGGHVLVPAQRHGVRLCRRGSYGPYDHNLRVGPHTGRGHT
jgi:glycosyltransferase involved in cell wall biosynthesis